MKKFTFTGKKIFLIFGLSVLVTNMYAQGGYVTGDFHQHSTYTDGSYTIGHVMQKNAEFGLDWWANSEHGGAFNRWATVSGVDLGTEVTWEESGIPLLGDATNGNMFRWQSLRDWSFRDIQLWRRIFADKLIVQGYEMNVPGHEHGSVGIIADQFNKENQNINPLAEFEYKFDESDNDISGGAAQGWIKSTLSGHAKTIEAIEWLQNNYAGKSWLIPAHPERKKKYNIAHFRDMNNAGPDVCFGFESMPGHQKESGRGGYSSSADGGGTYGGCGVYAAKIGGLWDAMLSEGRNFWLFASSDFHNINGDFYPGEYQKTYTYVTEKNDPEALAEGLRSGNSWVVEGDLIDMLDFKIVGSGKTASMGGTFESLNSNFIIDIAVRDPKSKNNFGLKPALDHIDIIMGEVTGKVNPEDSVYNVPEAPATKVIARFDNKGGITSPDGITSRRWIKTGGENIRIWLPMNIKKECYIRLRGTNHGLGVAGETDENGNPLLDIVGQNDSIKAINDLWFYSNPIFVKPKSSLKSATLGNNDENNLDLESQEITIYPNPAKDMLYFTNVQEDCKIKIYNISGKLLISKNLTDNAVDISNLTEGVYVANIQTDDNTKQLKFVVE